MFDIKKNYGTDKEKEIEGVWEDISEDARVLVARSENPEYRKRWRRIPRPIRQQITSGSLGDSQTDDILCRLLADTVLLDWEDIAEGGKKVVYSKENAYRLMREYPDFRELVWDLSRDLSRFRAGEIRETAKNSRASSAGS